MSQVRRLIELRNPWGEQGEWKGDWGKSAVKDAVGFDPEDDGLLFMSVEDLAANIALLFATRVLTSRPTVTWTKKSVRRQSYPVRTHMEPARSD